MKFYRGATVFATFHKASNNPPVNLIRAFIETGRPVPVTFDDGTNFKFNKEDQKK